MPDITVTNREAPLRTWLLLGLVLANIALQLINASLIKYASNRLATQIAIVVIVLAVVMLLSLARFALWGAMHKRFPVSITYPATALFFPCLVGLAWIYDEPVSAPQFIGACLVTLGVFVLLLPRGRSAARPKS